MDCEFCNQRYVFLPGELFVTVKRRCISDRPLLGTVTGAQLSSTRLASRSGI